MRRCGRLCCVSVPLESRSLSRPQEGRRDAFGPVASHRLPYLPAVARPVASAADRCRRRFAFLYGPRCGFLGRVLTVDQLERALAGLGGQPGRRHHLHRPRGRRACRRQTSQDTQPHGATVVRCADCVGRVLGHRHRYRLRPSLDRARRRRHRCRARYHGWLPSAHPSGRVAWPRPADRAARGCRRGAGRICYCRNNSSSVTSRFDAIGVGAGQAGPSLAGRVTAAGHTVAMVERKLIGGTCVNNGCIPTKTLVARAPPAHLARRGADFGGGAGAVSVDMAKVKARKDEIMLGDRKGVEDWLNGMDGCTVIRGHARFEDPHTLRVGDDVLQAERIFLNVGGRAVVPDIPGLKDVEFLTNVSILELDTVPEHLVIVGGSYIALEFAQMYRRFGARVTVIEKGPRLTSREDEDVSAAIKEILEAEGIDVVVGATAIQFTKRDSGFQVVPREGAEPITGTHLLVAVGRQPNTDDLGLDTAGVKTDKRGYIVVDDQLRTNVEHIWAMGDCNGRGAFTHTSYNDFEIVAANLLDNEPRRVSDRVQAYALYVDPPLGRVGLGETE